MSRTIVRIFLALALSASAAFAQSQISSSVTKTAGSQPRDYGNDFWFAIPVNESGAGTNGKVLTVYVTALQSGTVNFQVQGKPVITKPITANKVTIFSTTLRDFTTASELLTSGVVESNKAIHVWSDVDLSVNFMSRVTFSSDGMYVVPTIGWGKEYVVGSYISLQVASSVADYPSEFAVVSDQDGTMITIIPNYNIRADGNPTAILHPASIPFTELLNKGDCIQYQVVGNPSSDQYDLTGTVITSNNPIGVMGASACPYIQTDEPTCDYILDMMQPVSSWSNTYYTAPFAGRKYGGDAFLVIGIKDGQKIYRDDPTKTNPIATLSPKFGYEYLYEDVAGVPSKWTSDTSFMLVQYVCSSTHDAPNSSVRNQGDPAMVVINGADQYTKTVSFQVPTVTPGSGQTDFTNYVNLLVDSAHLPRTIYDGVVLNPKVNPPNVQTRQDFSIPNSSMRAIRLLYSIGTGQGTHIITSDTGVGVYVYGYGTDDSYALSGHLGIGIVKSGDTIPPTASISGACFHTRVIVTDSQVGASRLSGIAVDSIYNMSITRDPLFIPGAGMDSSYYDLHVIDSTNEAYAEVSIYDIAGNSTMETSTYKPHLLVFNPKQINFGSVSVTTAAVVYDTICNLGSLPYPFKSAKVFFASGKQTDIVGFSIDSVADGNIPPGGCRIIKIKFAPNAPPTVRDVLAISDGCLESYETVVGNGGQADLGITNYSFSCTDVDSVTLSIGYDLTNPSSIADIVDSIWLDDNTVFSFDKTKPGNQYPFTVPASNITAGSHEIIITFKPDSIGKFETIIHVKFGGNTVKTDTIFGLGCTTVAVRTEGYSSQLSQSSSEYSSISSQLDRGSMIAMLPPVPNPVSGGKNSVSFVFGLSADSPLDLSLYDILGNHIATLVRDNDYPSGIYQTGFTVSSNIPTGNYIYRLAALGKVISGKLVITR